MKKNYTFYSLLTAIPVAVFLIVGFTGGQGGNFSGSPGDSGSTCTSCHASGSNHGGSPILTGVPGDYQAGTTYNLTLSINGSSVNKFGFNITAEDQNNTKVGSWTAGTGSQLRSGGAVNGLTHTGAGSSSSSWSFSWTAPATNLGPVTFYYSTIQANNAGGNGGDQTIAASSSAVLSSGIELTTSSFILYPTQANDILNINLNQFSQGELSIYNMNGAVVQRATLQEENQINVTDLSAGIYLANVSVNGAVSTERFIKK